MGYVLLAFWYFIVFIVAGEYVEVAGAIGNKLFVKAVSADEWDVLGWVGTLAEEVP